MARSEGSLLHGQPELLEPHGRLVEAPARQDVGQTGSLHVGGQPARVLGQEPERP